MPLSPGQCNARPVRSVDYPYEALEWLGEEYIGIKDRKVIVYSAYDRSTGESLVIKRIPRGPCVDEYASREIMNRRLFSHPHIVSLKEILETETTLDIVLECGAGLTLASYASEHGCFSEAQARHFFQEIMTAVEYCHIRSICVRDVTLENFMLDAQLEHVKLVHLTASRSFPSSPLTRIGRCDYHAPELLLGEVGGEYLPFAVDVWAAGVLLYVLLFNIYPFSSPFLDHPNMRVGNTYERILTGEFCIPDIHIPIQPPCDEVEISQACQDLLRRMLEPDPSKRITVHEIFQHPWFLPGFDHKGWQANRASQRAYVDANNSATNEGTLRAIITRCRQFFHSWNHPHG